jgi:hypothetical protein
VIGRPIGQLPRARNVEHADFGAATRVAVTDDDDGVVGNQHLVVPRTAGVHVAPVGVKRRNRSQLVVTDADGEQTSATQDHQMLPVHLDDAAFVDAGVLHIGHRLVLGTRRFLGHRRWRGRSRSRRGKRLANREFRRLVAASALLVAATLCLVSPALEQAREFLFAGKSAQRLARRGRVFGHCGRCRCENKRVQRGDNEAIDEHAGHGSPFSEGSER